MIKWYDGRSMLKNWTIAQKLVASFLLNAGLLTGIAVFTIVEVNSISSLFTEYRETSRQTLALGQRPTSWLQPVAARCNIV